MTTELKLPRLARDLPGVDIRIRAKADDADEQISFAASSETPVERWWGTEILSHADGAVRLQRIRTGAAPLLFNHDWDDPIGMLDDARIEGGRLVVDAHLFATARAQEVRTMLDGGLRNVSIGYEIHVMEEEPKKSRFTATDWEPFEVSIVTIPADPSVGIGRAGEQREKPVRITHATPAASPAATAKEIRMDQQQTAPAGANADSQRLAPPADATSPVQLEERRKAAIVNLCRANKLDERFEQHWIGTGASLETVANEMVQILAERSKNVESAPAALGMSPKEVRRYSLMRALRAAANKDWTRAGLELEAHNAVRAKLNVMPRTDTAFFVPLDVQVRDMTAAGVSGSNYLVSTDNLAGSFIEMLRNTSVALRMGATRLPGLVGNVTIPRQTGANTAYWLADENTQITESQPTIGQLALAPKNVAALTEITHQLLQQSSPAAEQLIMTSIARDIALAVDVGVLRGSGTSGQPTGIVNVAGIGSVTGTSLAAAGILEFQSDVAANNALLPGCGYVTTPAVAALLCARPELPSTGTERLWKGNLLDGQLFNLPAMSSAQMSSATMLFGHWPSVIIAEWGVLELMVNPFSDFTRGLQAVRGWYTCDVGLRYPGAFSYASSIT